jgi:ABC-type dipeptide/oligopeptide/nickel transport system ATPase component
MNRNAASGDGILPSRNTLQQCGDEIAVGTKAIVRPIVDEEHHVYCVDLVDELKNITNADFIKLNHSLDKEFIRKKFGCKLRRRCRVERVRCKN